MARARISLLTAAPALAALLLVAAPAGAASAQVPQPRHEAPRHPLPASRATTSAITGFQGSWLDTALNLFQWDRVAMVLFAIFCVVVIAEVVVTQVRKRVI